MYVKVDVRVTPSMNDLDANLNPKINESVSKREYITCCTCIYVNINITVGIYESVCEDESVSASESVISHLNVTVPGTSMKGRIENRIQYRQSNTAGFSSRVNSLLASTQPKHDVT